VRDRRDAGVPARAEDAHGLGSVSVQVRRPASGAYFDEGGKPMQPSKQAQDVAFQNRVVAETRAFLAPFKT